MKTQAEACGYIKTDSLGRRLELAFVANGM
jgi:hypothetical protein